MKIKKWDADTHCDSGEAELEITGAGILNAKDAQFLIPEEDRKYGFDYWLDDDREKGKISICHKDGHIEQYDYWFGCIMDMAVIRPVLKIRNLKGIAVHDWFEFGGAVFEVLSENLAFSGWDIHYLSQDPDEPDRFEYVRLDNVVNKWLARMLLDYINEQ